MVRQDSSAQREEAYEGNGARRNPYLVDYEAQRRRRTSPGSRPVSRHRQMSSGYGNPSGRSMSSGRTVRQTESEGAFASGSRQSQFRNRTKELDSSWIGNRREEPGTRRPRSRPASQGVVREQAYRSVPQAERTSSRRRASEIAPPVSYDLAPQARPAAGRASASQRRALVRRRKKQILMQRLFVGAWILCILLFAVAFAVKSSRAAGNQKENSLPVSGELDENPTPQTSGLTVQGISAEKFAEHPEWTEDLLTLNEYSRPGNTLEEVNNIFVHYTANPGTSAAQNRSYFEWQKDTHEASVSAHFVIGYEGEIIQCVPLDEIAYAVMTRNYDSISIECCYLERDGSFTQATYDSLISLLSWLIDVYDLDSEDILRHYDCGGKKCPLYYTEHPGAWEQLKKDVDNFSDL